MIWRTCVDADIDLLAVHEAAPQRYPFLLQSAAAHPQSGRWDVLFADPGEALLGDADGVRGPGVQSADDNFFTALDRWLVQEPWLPVQDDIPLIGGWFILLGYEAARWVEGGLDLPLSPHPLPDALAVRCRSVMIFDRLQRRLHCVSEVGDAACKRLHADAQAVRGVAASGGAARARVDARISEQAPQHFLQGAARVLDYIRSGDSYQINLSRAWDAEFNVALTPAQLYRQLRQANPAPFAGLACWGEAAVISSSPERLLKLEHRRAQTRPIAGTRRRGDSEAEDQTLRATLISNVKERAEHVMLIDLERNDLGRVCVPGSVRVDELMTLESYAHVHHIVSNVCGDLRSDVGIGAALRAVFPGGTITGCPKVRSMQIIAELEGEGRGAYTGSMGYISRDQRMDSNILIRSMVLTSGHARLRAGAGIVADSNPEFELAETRTKARGLLLALSAHD